MFNAKRPVLIFGAGIRLAGACEEALAFAHASGIPVAPTWGALDIMPHDDPLFIGSFGTHGTRYGNFAVQNADLIIAVGTRLDTKATGTPSSTFARGARIIMVDIDQAEIDKFQHLGVKVDGVCEDAKTYLSRMVEYQYQIDFANTDYDTAENDIFTRYSEWKDQIDDWKQRYPICPPEYYKEEGVNPYVLVKELSKLCAEGDIICCDTGCAVAWMAQAFEFKRGQRFIHAWNQTPMGYGLPAAIGGHYATGRPVLLVTGDGSFMMQNELATVAGRKLPIKIVLLNNMGHAMCRQTQREWFGSKYESTSVEGGLCFPDFVKLARANGLTAEKLLNAQSSLLPWLMSDDSPRLLEAMINPDHDVMPKLFATKPLEDLQPYLDRDEFAKQMIVPML